jgi:hypothetical protein
MGLIFLFDQRWVTDYHFDSAGLTITWFNIHIRVSHGIVLEYHQQCSFFKNIEYHSQWDFWLNGTALGLHVDWTFYFFEEYHQLSLDFPTGWVETNPVCCFWCFFCYTWRITSQAAANLALAEPPETYWENGRSCVSDEPATPWQGDITDGCIVGRIMGYTLWLCQNSYW